MTSFRDQQKLGGEVLPIIVNTCNFNKPPEGEPALLSLDEASTVFHEFGHGLHGLLSDVTYPRLSGTSTVRDFVELPSQLYEHWLESAPVLAQFTHYKTGEPIPADLLTRLKAARNANIGFETVELISSALLDMAYHTRPAGAVEADTVEQETLAQIGMPHEIALRHASPHFLHIFSGDGYSAGYYSYSGRRCSMPTVTAPSRKLATRSTPRPPSGSTVSSIPAAVRATSPKPTACSAAAIRMSQRCWRGAGSMGWKQRRTGLRGKLRAGDPTLRPACGFC